MLSLSDKFKWVYGIGAFFTLMVAWLVYAELFYVAAIIPLFLIIVGVTLFKMDWMVYLIILSTPLSLNFEQLDFGLGVILPTEPLIFGVMVVFLAKLFYDHQFDYKVLRHPITVAIIVHLIWVAFSTIPSEMPIVSLKFLLSRLWFIVVFFFILTKFFKKPENFNKFFWLYILPLMVVIIYTIYQHAIRGFEEKPAHWVMQPFFKDHTSYGALLALYIPVIIGYLFNPGFRWNLKFLAFNVLLIFIVGIIFSYTRAAWVSLIAALGVYLLIQFRVKLWMLVSSGVLILAILFTFQEDILIKLEKNRQDSSGDLAEHVESISNVASDASNLERINRWNCALRMFEERPVFGWGPGTYKFQYAPFQSSQELTIISTNFGDLGNAHSEYLGPLAEMGVLGLLTFLAIIILFYVKSIQLYYKLQNKELKVLVMSSIAGFTTYVTHGILNNFLDTDKASLPFWGFMAVIVAIDVYYKNKPAEIEG